MTGPSPPTSRPRPRLQGSENTTPMHSFDKRRFSSIIGQTRYMGWWLQLEFGSISLSMSTQELEDVSNLTLIMLTDFI